PSRRSTSRRTRRPDSASRCARWVATRTYGSGRSTAMAGLPSVAAPRRAGADPGRGAGGAAPVRDLGMYGTAVVVPGGIHRHVHGLQAEAVEQGLVAPGLGIGGGEQLLAMEDRVGAGTEAQGLEFVGHLLAPGRQAHHR